MRNHDILTVTVASIHDGTHTGSDIDRKEWMTMSKVEELMATLKLEELMEKKDNEKIKKTILCIVKVVAVIAVIAGIAYAVYRFVVKPATEKEEDDFQDDFDDDFFDDDDFFEDDDEIEVEFVVEEPEAPAEEQAE